MLVRIPKVHGASVTGRTDARRRARSSVFAFMRHPSSHLPWVLDQRYHRHVRYGVCAADVHASFLLESGTAEECSGFSSHRCEFRRVYLRIASSGYLRNMQLLTSRTRIQKSAQRRI